MQKLSQTEIQKRIMEFKFFRPDKNGLKGIGRRGEKIDIKDFVLAIQSLVAAEKLENKGSPTNPLYKVIQRQEISLDKFFNNMRKLNETARMD